METAQKTTKKPKAVSTETKLEAPLYNQGAKSTGTITLPATVFGVKWNEDLVHQVAVSMMANARSGNAHTKDRSDVSGGGKKPWKQKGTGRARHGSSRSPIWVGGGVTFGPRNDKDYSKKINKKMRTKALFSVLSKKLSHNELVFVDSIVLKELKTKEAQNVLNSFAGIAGFERLATKKKTAGLMLLAEHNEAFERSFANIPAITVVLARELNTIDALKYKTIMFVGEKAVAALESKVK